MVEEEKILIIRNYMLVWYQMHGRVFPWRNKSTSKYELIICEILLQRTKAESVAKVYKHFFDKYSSWSKLAEADPDELSDLIKPLGLWKRRTASLKNLANDMKALEGRFPEDKEAIESLPNVGQYIANAIILFCHNTPKPLLDTNMARVLERFFGPRRLADIRRDPYLQSLAQAVVNCDKPKELNWAIIDFAAIVCKARNPSCSDCMLNSNCLHYLKVDRLQASMYVGHE